MNGVTVVEETEYDEQFTSGHHGDAMYCSSLAFGKKGSDKTSTPLAQRASIHSEYLITPAVLNFWNLLAQGDLAQAVCVDSSCKTIRPIMAPAMKAKKVAMKAMKGQKAMTKGALLGELATATEMKKSDITKVLNTLTEIGTQEVKKSGKFVLPGLCMIKTRQKAATKGGTRMMFGQEMKVKPQPAKTVVKAFPASQLKSQI